MRRCSYKVCETPDLGCVVKAENSHKTNDRLKSMTFGIWVDLRLKCNTDFLS